VGLHSPEISRAGCLILNVCSENRPGRGDRILLRRAREGKNSFRLVGVAASKEKGPRREPRPGGPRL